MQSEQQRPARDVANRSAIREPIPRVVWLADPLLETLQLCIEGG